MISVLMGEYVSTQTLVIRSQNCDYMYIHRYYIAAI